MDTDGFSTLTRECLARAGWTPDYVCPALDAYEAALVADGYTLHDAARAFLGAFGGLEIRFPHARVPGAMDTVSTRTDQAVAGIFAETAERWAEIVGAPLCLIGDVYHGYMGLAMDPAGRVFAGEGELVLKLGDSGEDAIEGLCTNREPVTIRHPALGIY